MQDEMEDKYADFRFLSHKKWCELVSTFKSKYNRNRAAA